MSAQAQDVDDESQQPSQCDQEDPSVLVHAELEDGRERGFLVPPLALL